MMTPRGSGGMALRLILGGALALAVAMGIGRFAYTPMLPAMQAGTGLSDADAGLLASINFAAYLFGALLVGRVPAGPARTLGFQLSLIFSVATTAGMAVSPWLPWWGLMRFVAGVASAGAMILGAAIVLDQLAALGQPARAGVVFAGAGLGIAASGAGIALFDVGWRAEWIWLGLAGAIGILPVFGWVRDPARVGPAVRPVRAPLPPSFWPLLFAYVCEGAGYVVTGTFLVTLLERMPEASAYGKVSWVVVGLAGAVATPLWTALAGRIGLRPALILAHLVQAAAILLPVAAPGPIAAFIGAAGFGGTFMAVAALVFALGRQMAPAQSSRVIGLLTVGFAIGQMVGPYPAGLVLAATGRADLPLVAAAALVAVGALALLIPLRQGDQGKAGRLRNRR